MSTLQAKKEYCASRRQDVPAYFPKRESRDISDGTKSARCLENSGSASAGMLATSQQGSSACCQNSIMHNRKSGDGSGLRLPGTLRLRLIDREPHRTRPHDRDPLCTTPSVEGRSVCHACSAHARAGSHQPRDITLARKRRATPMRRSDKSREKRVGAPSAAAKPEIAHQKSAKRFCGARHTMLIAGASCGVAEC